MRSFSVIVCTRNRASLLDRCLAGITAQGVDPDRHEVLVVDDGSGPATGAVARRWAARTPGLRYWRQPFAGLSHARNAGIRLARGDVLAYLDDDAIAQPGWLAALEEAYLAWPGVAAVAGPVALSWPHGRPGWLEPALESWYSRVDLGPGPRLLGPDEKPFGANLSVHRTVAAALGGFDPKLGRRGGSLRSNEDVHFVERLRRGGGSVLYQPGAMVVHPVSGSRLTRRWLLRRSYAQGRSDAILDHRLDPAPHRRAMLGRARHHLVPVVLGEWSGGEPLRQVVWRAEYLGYGLQTLGLALMSSPRGGENHGPSSSAPPPDGPVPGPAQQT